MAELDAYPYLRPARERIRVIDWQLNTEDGMAPLPGSLPDWDLATPLHVIVRVDGDTAGVRSDCGLHGDDRLRLVLVWQCPGTTLRGHGAPVDLDGQQSSWSTILDVGISGELLADRVRIDVQLVLARPGKQAARPAPRRSGSILWSETRTVLLEGRASRFPVEWVDFTGRSWLPEHAAWYLEWDREDLHQTALGSMRLYLNASNPRLEQAVTGRNAPEGAAIRETIRFDVARTMIAGALDNDEFVGNPDAYADGSVGVAVRRLVHALFPGDSIAGLRQVRRESPGRFDTLLQDRLKLFTEG